jgi:hypothetical protein
MVPGFGEASTSKDPFEGFIDTKDGSFDTLMSDFYFFISVQHSDSPRLFICHGLSSYILQR